jgi:hypothetical protein
MSTKLEKLLAAEVTKQTEAELEKQRPKIAAEVTKEHTQLVQARLDALRPSIERAVRAKLADVLLGKRRDSKHVLRVHGKTLTPQATQKMLATLDPITAARGITQAKKGWMCIYCETAFQTQRAASIHARSCDHRPAPNGTPQPKRQRSVVNKKGKAKARTCIKPGCRKKSKGPRYHHLCEEHKDTPKRQMRAWQKKDRETRAA